jgi:prophage regulatory protein
MESVSNSSPVFVRATQVANREGVSVATVWRWVREGKFPKPIKLGAAVTAWRISDIEAWEGSKK